jgi:hypothetical protein
MLHLRHPKGSGPQKGAIDVNAYAIFVVNEHLDHLLAEAAARRAVPAAPSRFDRLSAALASIRLAITTPADGRVGVLPKLDDYPYRS